MTEATGKVAGLKSFNWTDDSAFIVTTWWGSSVVKRAGNRENLGRNQGHNEPLVLK